MLLIRSALIVGLASALVFSLSVRAHASGTTSWFLIDVLKTEIQGSGFRIVPEGTVENPDGCSNPTAYFSPATTPANDQRLSLALAASNAGREVQVFLNGCENNEPKVVAIFVR